MDLDHETAWHLGAKPLFESLSPEIKALFAHVCTVAADLSQNHNCDMCWPDDGGDLRKRFEAFDDVTLATAALATNFYGHWSPEGTAASTGGGTWKFSNYADQVLRGRLDASPRGGYRHGLSFMIHEGVIRVGLSTKWSWTWDEVALATAENMATIRAAINAIAAPAVMPGVDRSAWDKYGDTVKARALKLHAQRTPNDDSPLAAMLHTERFKVPGGTLAKRDDDRRKAAKDAKRDVELVAAAIVAIRRACAAIVTATGHKENADHEVKLLFISAGTSDAFNARALARAAEIEAGT